MEPYSVVPKISKQNRRRILPGQSLKLCGYVCFVPGTFINVTGSTTEFPASDIALEDRQPIIRDALVVTLQNTFPLGSVMEDSVLLAVAPADDKYAFQCQNHTAIVCPPTVYADAMKAEWEEALLDDVAHRRDPRKDELLRGMIGDGNIRFFMHMHGGGDAGMRSVSDDCRGASRGSTATIYGPPLSSF